MVSFKYFLFFVFCGFVFVVVRWVCVIKGNLLFFMNNIKNEVKFFMIDFFELFVIGGWGVWFIGGCDYFVGNSFLF